MYKTSALDQRRHAARHLVRVCPAAIASYHVLRYCPCPIVKIAMSDGGRTAFELVIYDNQPRTGVLHHICDFGCRQSWIYLE